MLEISAPKNIRGTNYYTRTIWDTETNKGYISICRKLPDGTFEDITPSDLSKPTGYIHANLPPRKK